MSRRWRWSVVVVVATAVLGSFIPSSLAAAGEVFMHEPAASVSAPDVLPAVCFIPSCGKGSPAPSAPIITMTGMAALLAAAVVALAARSVRRPRRSGGALPRGSALLLFHPPQFS